MSIDILNKIPISDTNEVSIYFGSFNNLNTSSCSMSINQDLFLSSLRRMQGVLQSKYDNSSLRVYQYRDMFMTVDNNSNKRYYIEDHIDTLFNDKLCIIINNNRDVPKEQFPIIEKYTNEYDHKIKTITYNSIKINFIEQIGDNNIGSVFFVRLDFINNHNYNHNKVIIDCEKIIKNLVV